MHLIDTTAMQREAGGLLNQAAALSGDVRLPENQFPKLAGHPPSSASHNSYTPIGAYKSLSYNAPAPQLFNNNVSIEALLNIDKI